MPTVTDWICTTAGFGSCATMTTFDAIVLGGVVWFLLSAINQLAGGFILSAREHRAR